MNVSDFMGAMQNPQQYMIQYAMQGMIAQHPEQWKQAQNMFNGKDHKQQISELKKLYKSKGMNLDAVAKQWGITL